MPLTPTWSTASSKARALIGGGQCRPAWQMQLAANCKLSTRQHSEKEKARQNKMQVATRQQSPRHIAHEHHWRLWAADLDLTEHEVVRVKACPKWEMSETDAIAIMQELRKQVSLRSARTIECMLIVLLRNDITQLFETFVALQLGPLLKQIVVLFVEDEHEILLRLTKAVMMTCCAQACAYAARLQECA